MSDEQQKMYTQSQMEQIIKERIAKVAKRANEAEAQITSLTSQLEAQKNSLGTVDMLSQQLSEYKEKLSKSERKYQRHTTIAKHGLSSDIVDAVEWAYDKEMASLKKGDRIPLEDWIDIHKSNPPI
jgi:sugar-specific transcriptional regulator TrmB